LGRVTERAKRFVETHNWNNEESKIAYEKLLKDYEKLEKRSDKIFEVSDKQYEEINKQNKILELVSKQLSKYIPPQLYNSVFDGQKEISVTSRRRKLTIFFSDIVNFTSTTEYLESEDLTNMLNGYLTEMSNIALKYGGTIDKFIGDAIMIFFGDPETDGFKQDAINCVSMAIEMQRKMEDIRNHLSDSGIVKPFNIRIGITTGYVTVGNFGSNDRMDYTIIGNYVNLASRLESKAEKNKILISEETYSLIKDEITCIRKDEILVKGISYPIQTYEVIGFKKDIQDKVININSDGIKLKVDFSKLQNRDEVIKELRGVLTKLNE